MTGAGDEHAKAGRLAELRAWFGGLSPALKAGIVAVTAWNLTLIVLAQRSLNRTPADQLRGPKLLWRLICVTNTVGPLAYFRWGRRGR